MYAKLFLVFFNIVFYHKSGHKCFDRSGPFLQIRSQLVMLWVLLFLLKNRFNTYKENFENMIIALDPLKLCSSQNVKEVKIESLTK